VEDHPLEYADFEGVIPKGEYGAGDVIVWDRGTWELHGADDAASAIEAGELHVELHGEKLRGRVVLVRTGKEKAKRDRGEWIVLHKRDHAAVADWDPEAHPRSVVSGLTNEDWRATPTGSGPGTGGPTLRRRALRHQRRPSYGNSIGSARREHGGSRVASCG
jgi:bifunctional non-homologous end joining protein LigD